MNAFVAKDIAELRFAFSQDADFATAANAVAGTGTCAFRALDVGKRARARADRMTAKRHASAPGITGDLRLIFRPRDGGGIDLLMFGLRYHPDTTSIYHTAATRL